MTWERGTCRGPNCRAQIVWIVTLAGKRMPVDRDPVPHDEARADDRGLFVLDPDLERLRSFNAGELLEPDAEIYRAHWGTCADRERFARQ